MWRGIIGRGYTVPQFESYVQGLQLGAWRPQFCVLHNTAIPRLDQWHRVTGEVRMRSLERYYRDDQKWSAGPHLFVADDLIWIFTPLSVPGVHSPSWNDRSWGVEMVGDYDIEEFPASVYGNAVVALAVLHRFGGLNPDYLKLHKEDPRTTHQGCPGKNVRKAAIVAGVKHALADLSYAPAPAHTRPVLRRGATGQAVSDLQTLLGMPANLNGRGTFGPLTQAAVIRFQQGAGLVADGIVGAKTWAALGDK